jgi:hypothetical protein
LMQKIKVVVACGSFVIFLSFLGVLQAHEEAENELFRRNC